MPDASNERLMCAAFPNPVHSRSRCLARGDRADHPASAAIAAALAARDANKRRWRDVTFTPSPRGSTMVDGTPHLVTSSCDSAPEPPATSTTPAPARNASRPNSLISRDANAAARESFFIFLRPPFAARAAEAPASAEPGL